MDMNIFDRRKPETQGSQKPKMSKEAKMILLMTKVQQTHAEDIKEQSSFLEMIQLARHDIKKEINTIREIEDEKEEVEEQVEVTETETKTDTNLNPNLEIIRKIKTEAKPKVNSGSLKTKEPSNSYPNSFDVQQRLKHTKDYSSKHDLSKRAPFKC